MAGLRRASSCWRSGWHPAAVSALWCEHGPSLSPGEENSSYYIYLVSGFQILCWTLDSESPKFKPERHVSIGSSVVSAAYRLL